ncbi:MAG: hypothetical protein WCP28_21275 [Actinomycetes bacterium]
MSQRAGLGTAVGDVISAEVGLTRDWHFARAKKGLKGQRNATVNPIRF